MSTLLSEPQFPQDAGPGAEGGREAQVGVSAGGWADVGACPTAGGSQRASWGHLPTLPACT